MYLIHLPAALAGVEHWLFFDEDPRPDGCTHQAVGGVEFQDLDPAEAGSGDSTRKMPVLARHERQPHYRLFSCRIAAPHDYVILSGFAFHFANWMAFLASPVAKDDQWRPITAQAETQTSMGAAAYICVSIRPEGLWWERGDRLAPHSTSRLYGRWLSATEFKTEQGAVLVCPPAGASGRREGPVAWRDSCTA